MHKIASLVRWIVPVLLLAAPAVATAQEANISGRVMDEQSASLPGVTVTATLVGSGRQITAVSATDGSFRLVGMQAGKYNIDAKLSGFATTLFKEVELLVGQNATINIPMTLASVSETVTVTSTAPLVDSLQARVAGNVDARQMENLPISGRNWQQLSTMVKGITANSVNNQPGVTRDASFQLNLDGQQITQNVCCSGGFGQPGISRDAISEFQVITNLFDVTMGRSVGIQVQAVSKSGTNDLSGSAYGFFRDDAFNAKDPFSNRVLPYSNSQMGGTMGGPIVHDKMHYFGSYEYEREPNTTVLTPSALAGQSFSIPTLRFVHNGLGRVDYQLDNRNRFSVRSSVWLHDRPTEVAGHPSRINRRLADSKFTSAAWSHVGSQRSLHELKVNYFTWHHLFEPKAGSPLVPEYIFPGITLGPNWNYPEEWWERFLTTRYDYTASVGRHDLKIGAEMRLGGNTGWWLARSRGQMRFSTLPANATTRFPAAAATDPSQWDFSGLDASALRYEIYYAKFGGGIDDMGDWSFDIPRPAIAGWIGDTWRVGPRLSLNMGLRYDVGWKDVAPPGLQETDIILDTGRGYIENVGYRNNIRDLDNVAPRGGFAWNVTGRNDFVIRGGAGLYYSTAAANQPIDQVLWNGQRVITASFANDGKPGWILDPTRGVTADDILSGRVPLPPQSISVIAHDFKMPGALQSMLGFQKQLTEVIGFDADLVYNRGWSEDSQRDPNLFYDPATGLPKNATTAGRPNPAYGPINLKESAGKSEHMQLATSFTRRYRNNYQLGMTYTYMFYKKETGAGNAGYGATQMNTFDIMQDYSNAGDFQRHTFRVNGIWTLPFGVTAAGSFRYGSGNPTTYNSGVDLLGLGTNRIRRDGTIIPRNTFFGDAFQTLDLRVSKDIKIANAFTVSAIAEVFNIYDYKRYSYNVIETSSSFGARNGSAGDPRTGQLAIRVSW